MYWHETDKTTSYSIRLLPIPEIISSGSQGDSHLKDTVGKPGKKRKMGNGGGDVLESTIIMADVGGNPAD